MNIFEQSVHPGASADLRLWHCHVSEHHSAHVATLCVISAVHWALSVTVLYPAPCNCYWPGIHYWQLVHFFMLWWFLKKFILFCSCFWPQSFHSSSVGRFCRCWWASSCTMTSQSATLLKACRWADATTWLYTTFWFLCLCWIVLLCWERYACSCTVCPVGALPFTASQCALLWEKGVSGLCTEVESPRRGNGPPAALFHEVMNFSSSLESEGVQDGKNNNASQYMCIQRCGVYDKVAIKHWYHKY